MRCLMIFITLFIFSSCEDTENKDFEAHCDCMVYNSDVKAERYPFGIVAFIDSAKAKGCIKDQLNNFYLLYYDTINVAVYNQHPKQNIRTIEFFIKKYQTDTTRLYDFVQFDSSVRLTVERLCKDKSEKYQNGEYVWWRSIEYSTLTKPYQKTKDELLQTWYKWKE
jgi:hypothetical protein